MLIRGKQISGEKVTCTRSSSYKVVAKKTVTILGETRCLATSKLQTISPSKPVTQI